MYGILEYTQAKHYLSIPRAVAGARVRVGVGVRDILGQAQPRADNKLG